MDQNLWLLKDSERDLIRELEPARLAELDEDGLLALHKRVRRARKKHVKNYRRGASRNVVDAGARGAAHPTAEKARLRASVFEEALAVVSAELARVAHEEAEALKDERLAAARAARWNGVAPGSIPADATGAGGVAREHSKTTGGIKRDASSKGQGKQRQAKRDAK